MVCLFVNRCLRSSKTQCEMPYIRSSLRLCLRKNFYSFLFFFFFPIVYFFNCFTNPWGDFQYRSVFTCSFFHGPSLCKIFFFFFFNKKKKPKGKEWFHPGPKKKLFFFDFIFFFFLNFFFFLFFFFNFFLFNSPLRGFFFFKKTKNFSYFLGKRGAEGGGGKNNY